MSFFHGHPATATAHKFHGGQFVFADMGLIHTRGTTEAAIFCIAAWITQMPRLIGNRPAAFTCIGHMDSPFLQKVR
jgi:hypothetical protein